jgi:hypothetical protein
MDEIKVRSVNGYWLIAELGLMERNGKEFCPYVSLYRETDGNFVGTIGWREFPKSLNDALRMRGFSWPRSKAYSPERPSRQGEE